jgi:hypothetical protein
LLREGELIQSRLTVEMVHLLRALGIPAPATKS